MRNGIAAGLRGNHETQALDQATLAQARHWVARNGQPGKSRRSTWRRNGTERKRILSPAGHSLRSAPMGIFLVSMHADPASKMRAPSLAGVSHAEESQSEAAGGVAVRSCFHDRGRPARLHALGRKATARGEGARARECAR